MMRIPCPWCGPRDVTEFAYSGEAASARRPADPLAVPLEAWCEHVYLRDNPRGPHEEIWQHAGGCRRYLRLRRDTLTHEVIACGPPGAPLT